MSKTEKEKWNEFLEWISNHSSTVYYRGESNNENLLMPKVGRNNYSLVDEINMLEHFKRKANMYVKANNKYLDDYDETKESNYLMYWDANALYGGTMCEYLPYGGFKFIEVTDENIQIALPSRGADENFL